MSDTTNKRRRINVEPTQWSAFRQAWNAASLAECVTELKAQVETLEEALQIRTESLRSIREAHTELRKAYAAICDNRALEQATNAETQKELRECVKVLEKDAERHKTVAAAQEASIADLNIKNAELRRQVHEQQGRAKTWRTRYEKLVERGAAALASKTVAEYGVTPDEVSLYKDFAAKQAEAARAAEAARQAALQATHMGLKVLEN